MLNNYASAIGIENIVALASFERERDTKLFRGRNHIPYHFFNLPHRAGRFLAKSGHHLVESQQYALRCGERGSGIINADIP